MPAVSLMTRTPNAQAPPSPVLSSHEVVSWGRNACFLCQEINYIFYANLKPMVISFSLIYKYTNANTEIQIQIQRLGLGYDEMWVAGSLGPITLITQ